MEYGIHSNMASRILVDNLAKGEINDYNSRIYFGSKIRYNKLSMITHILGRIESFVGLCFLSTSCIRIS